jgi:O-antigen/teichoic acid export membrane protein
LLLMHLGLSTVIVCGLCVVAGVMYKLGLASGLPATLLGVAFATPSVLLFWILKRVFYLRLSPGPSVVSALLYCVLTIGGLAVVAKHGLLSTLSALLLMGFGGLISSVVLLTYLGLRLPRNENAPSLVDTWGRHWRYGRWALGANAMMWIPINAFYPLLSRFSGMAQAGELKALMNFAAPMLQTCAALSSLMLPYSARVLGKRGAAGVSVVLRRMTLLCVCCAIPYWVVLVAFKGPAFRLLYSGQYLEVAYLMPVLAVASVFGSAFFGPSIVLRSMESPRLVFAAVSASSCIAIVIGVPLTRALGVAGAVWSIALSEALAFVAAVILVRREARRSLEAPPICLVLSASESE